METLQNLEGKFNKFDHEISKLKSVNEAYKQVVINIYIDNFIEYDNLKKTNLNL
jgi:hypothetical protein